jgi:drug/metabolite transporter (DMT)-like permease
VQRHSEHWRACFWLLAATLTWGLSFPLVKALHAKQEALVPNGGSVFFASLAATVRFGIAGVVVAIITARTLRKLTRLEITQGLWLALFGGLGILFQMDALAHTSASTSAFLTQFYCLLIPIWAAWRQRAIPRLAVIGSSVMVLVGCGVLANFQWSELKIGRGEGETILAAVFFAGQILLLERPRYAANHVMHFTVVMFVGIAVLLAPFALFTAPTLAVIPRAYSEGSVWVIMGSIILFCTLGAYLVMNRWQRFVTATEAGLIYCVEPVAASLFALFLPEMLSTIAGVNYANEVVTWRLLAGGALITGANVLIQFEAMTHKPNTPEMSRDENEGSEG